MKNDERGLVGDEALLFQDGGNIAIIPYFWYPLDMKQNEHYHTTEHAGVTGWMQDKTGDVLLGLVTSIPNSVIPKSDNPALVSDALIEKACIAAAIQSGSLALPGGPIGLLTIFPDLLNIWRIQSQLVADIAAVHGKVTYLRREEMAWCLFRHAATQIAREFLVRAGQRALTSQLTNRALHALLRGVGARFMERMSGRWLFRLVPLLGIVVAGGFAWWDTREVGRTAVALFGKQEVS